MMTSEKSIDTIAVKNTETETDKYVPLQDNEKGEGAFSNPNSVAFRLRRLLEIKGMRGTDLAKATGIPYGSFCQWTSARNIPRQKALVAIALYTGVDILWLLGKKPLSDIYPDQAPNSTENELVELFRKLSPDRQQMFLLMLRTGFIKD